MLQDAESIQQPVADALARIGMTGAFALHRVSGGLNNRVYRVDVQDRAPLLLKSYYRSGYDQRDRLSAEYSFSRLLWDGGVRELAEPLASFPEHRCSLFRFIDGERFKSGEIGAAEVDAALAFIVRANRDRLGAPSSGIGLASDACLSAAAHLDCLKRRIAGIMALDTATALERDARTLTVERIVPAAEAIERPLVAEGLPGIRPAGELPQRSRCLSPSDFGFHNALRARDGAIVFCDFEYAGWDDPAKLVADFFAQESVQVPLAYYDSFADRFTGALGLDDTDRQRMDAVLPLHRLKWVCMILQDFLPGALDRRMFATVMVERESYLAGRLARARELLDQIGR